MSGEYLVAFLYRVICLDRIIKKNWNIWKLLGDSKLWQISWLCYVYETRHNNTQKYRTIVYKSTFKI